LKLSETMNMNAILRAGIVGAMALIAPGIAHAASGPAMSGLTMGADAGPLIAALLALALLAQGGKRRLRM
jgi:hypothetical protein